MSEPFQTKKGGEPQQFIKSQGEGVPHFKNIDSSIGQIQFQNTGK